MGSGGDAGKSSKPLQEVTPTDPFCLEVFQFTTALSISYFMLFSLTFPIRVDSWAVCHVGEMLWGKDSPPQDWVLTVMSGSAPPQVVGKWRINFISSSPCLAFWTISFCSGDFPERSRGEKGVCFFLLGTRKTALVRWSKAGLTGPRFPTDQGRCLKSLHSHWQQRELLSHLERPSQPTWGGEGGVGRRIWGGQV